MSGIEPESERIVPRISTSVVDLFYSPESTGPTKETDWLTAEARKLPLFTFSGVDVLHSNLFVALHCSRSEYGTRGRDPVVRIMRS